ncbi:phytoene desaturase [Terriglobus roseus DSM 18391]|uniref:Phytoene desaturase n=1 Tax=Terriglobus roseus (strain DSM 18391 / NRRL B-41598 / KBS 63) TaxID=926566 RepID=I3ZBS7_TERRK|nr:phytoene desaturase family protein [Terriglobus roseus]AFL86695.1 phytoene desaturase [Terriglobus roseus DSM 18391]
MRVAVIGSGLAGLAAAATLAGRGYTVEVFEKNPWLGGKAAQLQEEGFRFDMGPTILIQPSVLRKIFAEAGRKLEDYLNMVRLDPSWRCFFEDGTVIDLKDSTPEMIRSLNQKQTGLGDKYGEFLKVSEDLHTISDKFFFWKPVGSMLDTLDWRGAFDVNVLKDVMKMRMGKTVSGVIREYISDDNTAQMLDHFVQYVGSSPDASPAILCAIGHMQTDEGIWYPMGGTRAVPEALVKLGKEMGVKYHVNADVAKIELKHGRESQQVAGITLTTGETYTFDAVVSNEDAVRTHRELLKGTDVAASFDRRKNWEAACSGVVLYLGLNKRYDHLAHHDFVFSRDPHEEFNAIYNMGMPAPDPTCYLASTSRTEPETAPPGGDALYVLVHTPYLRPNHDWREMFPGYRQVILDKLKRTGGMPDIEERIVFERALTPQDIHDRYRVLDGAIYGLSSHGRMNGAFKPSNVVRGVEGLFLAGGAAHPGPGMPMVMMSGWIAADALDRRYQQGDNADRFTAADRKSIEMAEAETVSF